MITDQTHTKKLFLLDALALIYRAHFAFSKFPRMTSTGINTSAIFGFTNTLLDILNKEKPSHIGVVFDTAAPTTRHEMFKDYKAHREAMPEDLVIAIPYIREIISAFNIPILEYDGFEADDVIGTLSKKAESNGFLTYMMTPDKDFAQLVTDKTLIYKPGRKGDDAEILGTKEILAKWEINEIKQVIDILALWGDAVDNIPGIPGIGEKTAKLLIKQYGSVENLIAHALELKGKQKENVVQYAQQGLDSKKLATIICNVDIEFNKNKLQISEPDKEKLQTLFAKLEFKTFGQRLLGDTLVISSAQNGIKNNQSEKKEKQGDLFSKATEYDLKITEDAQAINKGIMKTISDVEHNYILVDTYEKRKVFINDLKKLKSFCFDTETTSINANDAEIVGLSISIKPHEAFYIPFSSDQFETKKTLTEFQFIFEDKSIEKIGQNIKYDRIVLTNYGINVQGPLFDTMLAHYLIQPEMRHNMNILSETYLGYSPIPIEQLIGKKGKAQGSMRDVPIDKITEYACEDADVTLQLKNVFEPLLVKYDLKKLFYEVEIPLIEVLSDMEKEGISIDIDALKSYSLELEKDIKIFEKEIYIDAGEHFNIASPKQLGTILFEKLKLDAEAKKTKTGQYATGEEVLTRLASKHVIVQKVLDYRGLQKLKSTYVDTLPGEVLKKTNRVHTSYNQAIAVTGRLSSQNPNLQNIPIRTEKGREVRKAFVPRNKDYVLLSADYSQIELRIIAEICKDEGLLAAFLNKEDIHTATASKIYNVEPGDVTDEMRRNAKTVNFGIIYGISAFGLSQRLNIPRKDAKYIIDQYFEKYPKVKTYMEDTIRHAKEKGYVETILGRRRYLRDINSQNATVRGFAERNAINSPIQGSAADMIKIAMIKIHRELKERNLLSKMVMQVHDELVFDVHKNEIDIVKPIVEENMKNTIPMKVPIEVEIGIGENWLKAH